jgi:glycine betaine/proline transport system substrate-binding protein
MKKGIAFILIIAMSMFMVACGGQSVEDGQEAAQKPVLKFSDAGWDSIKFHDEVAKLIIENGFGYETEVVSGSSTATWLGLQQGDIDIMMEAWSDNIADYNDVIEAGTVLELGTNLDANMQGLYVPLYVIEGDAERGIEPMAPELKTVQDLVKYTDLFADEEEPEKGRIYNAPPGWMAAEILENKFQTYEMLDTYNLFSPGSGTSLAASLTSAYEKGEPWVGYYWEPTWVSGMYDLVLLEEAPYDEAVWNDGYGCSFNEAHVTVAVHPSLKDNAPDVYALMQKYGMTSAETAVALAYMQQNDASTEDTAIWFMKEHQDIWTPWVTEEQAEAILAAIE